MGTPRLKLPIGVQVNQVTRLLSAPCNGKWSLAVELAIPALGEAMLTLLTPDPKQILQNYLRPKGSRAGGRFLQGLSARRHSSAAGRRYRMFGVGFPDVDEMIGDSLPGRKFFAGRTIGTLEKWMWTGIEFSDLVGWYWLMLNVTEQGLLSWSSNIFHSVVCQSTTSLAGSWKLDYTSGGIRPFWSFGSSPWLHNEKNCEFGLNGRFAPIDNVPMKGCYVNVVHLFKGQGFASMGPFTLTLRAGVIIVFQETAGSQESLDVFETGNLQCEAHFETDVTWDSGELTMGEGDGTGYIIETAHFEGQIFGGFS